MYTATQAITQTISRDDRITNAVAGLCIRNTLTGDTMYADEDGHFTQAQIDRHNLRTAETVQ